MKPGELYWVEFPLVNGREQAGRRPSLILQDDAFGAFSPLVLTIPLTSSAGSQRFPAVVPVPITANNKLNVDSFALVFQIRATDRSRLRTKIGEIEPSVLDAVHYALDRLTGRRIPTVSSPMAANPSPN